MCSGDIFLGLIAILFPPIAVWVKRGLCSADSVINIALCMLGFIPGLLHAWYIIAKYPDMPEDYEPLSGDGGENGGRVTYYYVAHGPVSHPPPQHQQQRRQPQRAYGTNEAIRVEGPKQDGQRQESGVEEQGGQGSSGAVPPSYEQAVKGDHKVQT